MMTTQLAELGIMVLAMIVAACASAAETSLTSLSLVQIETLQTQDYSGRLVAKLRQRAENFLPTILMINTTGEAIASAMATLLLAGLFPPPWNGVFAGAGFSLIVVITCELTPKSMAVDRPVPIARFLARAVRVFSIILLPIIFVVSRIVTVIRFVLGERGRVATARLFSEDELQATIRVAEKSGVIPSDETAQMRGIHKLRRLKAYSVMTAREQMIAIPARAPVGDALRLFIETGKARIPVYEGSRDNVIGILYAKKLLEHVGTMNDEVSLKRLMREPFFVPEWILAHDLLARLQRENRQLAILLNEYGGTAGIVTMEDILEEIVGDFGNDEEDRHRKIEDVPGRRDAWIVDGLVRLDEINQKCKVNLAHKDVVTLGGLVLSRLGEGREGGMPAAESVTEFGDVKCTVTEMVGNRVSKVHLEILNRSDSDQHIDDALPDLAARASGDRGADALVPPSDGNVALWGEHTPVREEVPASVGR